MVHPASFPHTIMPETGVENPLELVHSLHSDVDIRRYAAHIRVVPYDITLQKRTRTISQHNQQKHLVHHRRWAEDGRPDHHMRQTRICQARAVHLHRDDTDLVIITRRGRPRLYQTDAKQQHSLLAIIKLVQIYL